MRTFEFPLGEAEDPRTPCPPLTHTLSPASNAAPGAIYRRARGGAVNSQCSVECRTRNLLQRPGDWAIGRAIGLGVYELIAARVQLAGNRALIGLPAKSV